MKKLIFLLSICFIMASCHQKNNRWDIETTDLQESIEVKNVSAPYFDSGISNEKLKEQFPDFFAAAPDSILTKSRQDSLSLLFNERVEAELKNLNLKDSVENIFKYVKHYYPALKTPVVYTFTGEMPYANPIAYFARTGDMVIGLDWFLNKDEPLYQKIGIPTYLTKNMTPAHLKSAIAESIARQVVPFDIRKRKFIEQILYEGKVYAAKKAFMPYAPDYLLLGYTPEEWEWCLAHEKEIYTYFTENDLFFSDDKKLKERFIDEAPFSKFYGTNDAESPGKTGTWLGYRIAQSYLDNHPEVSLPQFLENNDYLSIFNESGYKP